MNLEFKKCLPKDVAKLTEISRYTFYVSYKNDNDPENLRTFLDEVFTEDNLVKELHNPNAHFYFVYNDHVLVGYFKLTEQNAQPDQLNKPSIKLSRIYLLPEFQGKGFGKAMIEKILEFARERHVDLIWLGVWSVNKSAIAFYQRMGFRKFGLETFILGSEEQEDWLMRLDLA